MSIVPENTRLGVISILEVFQYYDGPKLFSAYNNSGAHFLALWLGEEYQPTLVDRWLYVPVSQRRLVEIKAGKIDLLSAYRNPEDDFLWVVSIPSADSEQATATITDPLNIIDDDLPLPGSRIIIDEPKATIPVSLITSLKEFLPLIPSVDSERRYWFVRTSGGRFYEDFYYSNTIGIGFNKIKDADLRAAAAGGTAGFDDLKDKIEIEYPKAQSRYVAQQLLRFALDIKAGDIVLIPSESSHYISIGEVLNTTISQEKGDDNLWDDSESVESFRKRKSVRWLKQGIAREKLSPSLYTSFYSHHIITDVSDKSADIDRTLYSVFKKGDQVFATVEVTKTEGIYAKDLFGLGYKLIELSDEITRELGLPSLTDTMEVKTNIQSPGYMEFIGPASGGVIFLMLALLGRALLGENTSFSKQGETINYSYSSDNLLQQLTIFFNSLSQRNLADRQLVIEEEKHRTLMDIITKSVHNMNVVVRQEIVELLISSPGLIAQTSLDALPPSSLDIPL